MTASPFTARLGSWAFAAIAVIISQAALAQAKSDTEPQRSKPTTVNEPRSLAGIDANENGVRDDIEAFVARNAEVTQSKQAQLEEANTKAQLMGPLKSAPPRGTQQRSNCSEYFLLDDKSRVEVDRYVMSKSSGAFGTHPCDPVVSPLIERPYPGSLRLDLGPVSMYHRPK